MLSSVIASQNRCVVSGNAIVDIDQFWAQSKEYVQNGNYTLLNSKKILIVLE